MASNVKLKELFTSNSFDSPNSKGQALLYSESRLEDDLYNDTAECDLFCDGAAYSGIVFRHEGG